MQCTECKFFKANEAECRRYAPQPTADGKKAQWPTVAADDWCGEFKASAEAGEKAA